ncbi:MAG TPA: ATP-dependent DNA helicase RecG [Anaerolineae bacterium]
MENAFSRLLKVLVLERKQGYRNKAVIGGLDKFASRWEVDARAGQGNQAVIGEVVALLIGYPSVDETAARERIIDLIVRRIHEAESAAPSADAEPAEPATRQGASGSEHGKHERMSGLPAAANQSRPRPPAETPPAPPEGAGRGEGRPATRAVLPHPERPGGREHPAQQAGPKQPADESGRTPPSPLMGRTLPAVARPFPQRDARAKPPTADAWGAAGPLHEAEAASTGTSAKDETLPASITPPEPAVDASPSAEAHEETAGSVPRPQLPDRTAQDGGLRPEEQHRGWEQPAQPAESDPAMAEEAAHDWTPGGWQPEAGDEAMGEANEARPAPLPRPRGRERGETAPGHGLDAPVTRLPSIGPSLAEKLAKLGVETIRDMLYLLPRRYDDFSAMRTIDTLRYGEEVTIIGTIWQVHSRQLAQNRSMTTAVVGDGTGEIAMTWFNPFIERQLHSGRPYLFSGKIDSYRGQLQMRSPEFEPLDSAQIHTGRLVPIYPLTAGISERWLRSLMDKTVRSWAGSVPDYLPTGIRQEVGLVALPVALTNIHFPDNQNQLTAARRRLSFDEFFILQLGVLSARRRFRCEGARSLATGQELLAPFLQNLPFAMTTAQQRVLDEIAHDLANTEPMSRLLQGDVGSGKTAVAAAALWLAVANGAQGAIMAPTEILAEQHARGFEKFFEGLTRPGSDQPLRVALLTGRQRKAEREETLAALSAGEIDIAVGTHALIQDEVTFKELAVAVVDEQHRFGVEQRAALRQKGSEPHMLVMSATPIPRSLALTLYGDLDVSVIDEMPAGRTPIRTKWLTSTQRERAYSFIRRQVESGRQAFIIYPLVEESENSEAKAAVEEHEHLQKVIFPELRLGLLHGRMKADEKDGVMRAFADGELQVLVATSVVEVGIDVPNATVIMIESAERFGLAQLHQFRGRVGRGAHASYCILISDAGEGSSSQRLQALETSTDGFALAQIDLEMRGPGDFLGTRQSGLPPLQFAQLSDLRTLEEARAAAQKLFAVDPQLAQPEHRAVAERVAEFWHEAGDLS